MLRDFFYEESEIKLIKSSLIKDGEPTRNEESKKICINGQVYELTRDTEQEEVEKAKRSFDPLFFDRNFIFNFVLQEIKALDERDIFKELRIRTLHWRSDPAFFFEEGCLAHRSVAILSTTEKADFLGRLKQTASLLYEQAALKVKFGETIYMDVAPHLVPIDGYKMMSLEVAIRNGEEYPHYTKPKVGEW